MGTFVGYLLITLETYPVNDATNFGVYDWIVL